MYHNINNVWTQIGSDLDGESANDDSGLAVIFSSDGTVIAVGATYNDGNGSNSGHVRIFKYISNAFTTFPDYVSITNIIKCSNNNSHANAFIRCF